MPEWIQNSSLEKIDEFIGIKTNLQSISDDNIFATGDVASIQDYRRPKSGVMAVRQGQILKENIFLKIQGKKLKRFRPQKNWLYIISTYPNKALLNYLYFSFHSKWCWVLKKWIDKTFIKKFSFPNKSNMKKKIISNYPNGKQQSAVMALLYIAQRQNDNWIPLSAMKYIAKMLEMPYIKVYEVATFYTMYNLAPVGDYFFQVCTTTPCMIRGAYKLVDVCKKKISEKESEITENGKASWMEVECLGACVNAPMIQINDDYFEDLNQEKLSTSLRAKNL